MLPCIVKIFFNNFHVYIFNNIYLVNKLISNGANQIPVNLLPLIGFIFITASKAVSLINFDSLSVSFFIFFKIAYYSQNFFYYLLIFYCSCSDKKIYTGSFIIY